MNRPFRKYCCYDSLKKNLFITRGIANLSTLISKIDLHIVNYSNKFYLAITIAYYFISNACAFDDVYKNIMRGIGNRLAEISIYMTASREIFSNTFHDSFAFPPISRRKILAVYFTGRSIGKGKTRRFFDLVTRAARLFLSLTDRK